MRGDGVCQEDDREKVVWLLPVCRFRFSIVEAGRGWMGVSHGRRAF
jgi:hypothetical protein